MQKYIIGVIVLLFVGIMAVFFMHKSRVDTQTDLFATVTEKKVVVADAPVPAPNFMPDFTLERLGGGTITLSEYRGKKPVILDFFATWCHNCRRDMPIQNTLYEKYKNQIEIIAINLQEKPKTVERYISKNNFTHPVAFDDGVISNQYGVRFTNTHFLVNKDGTFNGVVQGDITEEHFLSLIGE